MILEKPQRTCEGFMRSQTDDRRECASNDKKDEGRMKKLDENENQCEINEDTSSAGFV